MATFDPAAATAVYLAQMSPAAQARAIAYTHDKEWMLLADWVVTIVVTWLIVRTGALPALRDLWQRRQRRPMLASFATGLGYFALSWLLGLPWAIYSGWWFEKSFGMTSQPLGGWFVDQAIQSAFSVVIGAVFLVLLYLFLRVARRSWWLWAAGLTGVFFAFLMFVQPLVLEPMLNKYTPAPPGAVRDAVVELGHKTGTPTDKIFIYNGSKQSNRYTANVAGLFGTARVAMSDVMFKKGANLAEVRGVVGHEMGHYVHNHGLWLMGGFTLIALFVFWATDRLFPFALRLFGARAVSDIADPAGVAVLFAVISTIMLLLTPVTNTMARVAEADADTFSLTYANEPDGLSEALIKTADYRAPTPSVVEEVMFYDHPSVSRRIRKAMSWKAKHLPPEAACVDSADHSVRTCPLPDARPAAPKVESNAPTAPKAQ